MKINDPTITPETILKHPNFRYITLENWNKLWDLFPKHDQYVFLSKEYLETFDKSKLNRLYNELNKIQ